MWGGHLAKPRYDRNGEEDVPSVDNGLEVQSCRLLRQNNDLIGFGALFDWDHDTGVNLAQDFFD
jgi:hypothetical protein